MRLRCLALVLPLSLAATMEAKPPPVLVARVEPPNWWAGMRHNRVSLLVYGASLTGVRASSASQGVRVTRVADLDSDAHALVEIELDDRIEAGDYVITIGNGSTETQIGFPIRRRTRGGKSHRGFSSEDVVYLITPDRFANGDPTNDHVVGLHDDTDRGNPSRRHGGDLRGIVDRLDYLRDLGVTTLWLNPVLENNGRMSYHGYGATDLYRIDPRLGDVRLYSELVREAHDRGLKVIFDHVNNHIGVGHHWVERPPMRDWFNGSRRDHLRDKHYLMAIADPHADRHSAELLKTFWFVSAMPDLNCGNPVLSDYRIQNTIWWIETTGIDGIREDTYPYVDQGHLTRWARAVRYEYPEFNIVGEVWNNAPAYVALFQEGQRLPGSVETALPAVMDFPLMEAFRAFARGDGKLRDVYSVLAQDFLYSDPSNVLIFADNHDTPRLSFIADDVRRVKLVLTLLLTTRGIPQLLYGSEIGMIGGPRHVDLRADFPGGFPGDERSAFSAEGRNQGEQDMFGHLQSLLRLRAAIATLRRGDLIQYPVSLSKDVYKFMRVDGEVRVLVIANGESDDQRVDLSEVSGIGEGSSLTDALSGARHVLGSDVEVEINGLSASIYHLDDD